MPEDLTETERLLWAAYPRGQAVDLRTGEPARDDLARARQWGPDRTVRGEVVRALLLGAQAGEPGHVAGVKLYGARVTGPVDIAHGTVDTPVELHGCAVVGAVLMRGARTRTIRLHDCALPFLDARGIDTDGSLYLDGSVVRRGVRLTNARVSGSLYLQDARLLGTVADAEGALWSVLAHGLTVGGSMVSRRLVVEAGLQMPGARIDHALILTDARLGPNPSGDALGAEGIITPAVEGGFTAEGEVRLAGAVIERRLDLLDAALRSPGIALDLSRARVGELILHPREPMRGDLWLGYATVDSISDDPRTWPPMVRMNGLRYQAIRHPSGRPPVKERLALIDRDPYGYRPQPYEQLASWYRSVGHEEDAQRVLLAKQRRRRRTLNRAGRAWGHLLDATVAYGYRPWRAVAWLAGLVAAGTAMFTLTPPAPVKPGEAPQFTAFFYALDLLIPFDAFGQQAAYAPTGALIWFGNGLIAAGWVLATTVIAGATRALGRA